MNRNLSMNPLKCTFICVLTSLIVGGFSSNNACNFPDTVHCADKSKCIHVSDICNFMPDCQDYSDENPDFCQTWPRASECRYGYIMCPSTETYILNYCITLSEACRKGCSVMPSVDTCNIIDSRNLPTNSHDFGCLSNQNMELLKALSESFSKTFDNSTSSGCPTLYNSIGDYCISTFLPVTVTWDEAKIFCESIGGNLLVVSDVTRLKEILDFFKQKKIDGDFWIGGKYERKDGWTWLNEKKVPLGAPFWGLMQSQNFCKGEESSCSQYEIMPELNKEGQCISMGSNFHYYFGDEPCLTKKSPLCFYEPVIKPTQISSQDKKSDAVVPNAEVNKQPVAPDLPPTEPKVEEAIPKETPIEETVPVAADAR